MSSPAVKIFQENFHPLAGNFSASPERQKGCAESFKTLGCIKPFASDIFQYGQPAAERRGGRGRGACPTSESEEGGAFRPFAVCAAAPIKKGGRRAKPAAVDFIAFCRIRMAFPIVLGYHCHRAVPSSERIRHGQEVQKTHSL
jgi:hypothetical protein